MFRTYTYLCKHFLSLLFPHNNWSQLLSACARSLQIVAQLSGLLRHEIMDFMFSNPTMLDDLDFLYKNDTARKLIFYYQVRIKRDITTGSRFGHLALYLATSNDSTNIRALWIASTRFCDTDCPRWVVAKSRLKNLHFCICDSKVNQTFVSFTFRF